MRTNKPIPIYIRDDETEPYRRATTFGSINENDEVTFFNGMENILF